MSQQIAHLGDRPEAVGFIVLRFDHFRTFLISELFRIERLVCPIRIGLPNQREIGRTRVPRNYRTVPFRCRPEWEIALCALFRRLERRLPETETHFLRRASNILGTAPPTDGLTTKFTFDGLFSSGLRPPVALAPDQTGRSACDCRHLCSVFHGAIVCAASRSNARLSEKELTTLRARTPTYRSESLAAPHYRRERTSKYLRLVEQPGR